MTYKYFEVRREIYNKCSGKEVKKVRSFSDMKRLFKWSYWGMLILMFMAAAAFVVLAVALPGTLYYLIPIPVVFFVPIILEFSCDKIYNTDERNRELSEAKESYMQYIQGIKNVLESCGIDSIKKQDALREECISRLEHQANPYNAVKDKTYNMLIGIPLGALVSSVIYKNESGTEIAQIAGLIMFGLLLMGIIKTFKTLTYYSDGHFKDRYLLEVLNEIRYHQEL